eukprot:CAMPEP_0117775180 /NCGR_PEP_ID=MMETSP0947-20121206/26973_1 /TAXON_ID=44440 /ORGANISM="Chattonella subsalsa, Strain CCMP2191" /LENGTH=130 /DNA_ID=CAMNT_0005601815 /DNA_START=545 /DNA_END=937 /DNA_ORIENTATION=+
MASKGGTTGFIPMLKERSGLQLLEFSSEEWTPEFSPEELMYKLLLELVVCELSPSSKSVFHSGPSKSVSTRWVDCVRLRATALAAVCFAASFNRGRTSPTPNRHHWGIGDLLLADPLLRRVRFEPKAIVI